MEKFERKFIVDKKGIAEEKELTEEEKKLEEKKKEKKILSLKKDREFVVNEEGVVKEKEERLPGWVSRIQKVYEEVKNNKKVFHKLTKHAREDIEIIEELRKKDRITELQYWEDVRDWLHDNAVLDSWWGFKNIEK